MHLLYYEAPWATDPPPPVSTNNPDNTDRRSAIHHITGTQPQQSAPPAMAPLDRLFQLLIQQGPKLRHALGLYRLTQRQDNIAAELQQTITDLAIKPDTDYSELLNLLRITAETNADSHTYSASTLRIVLSHARSLLELEAELEESTKLEQ
jgi:hypothetical protein